MNKQKMLDILKSEQEDNGSFGRFHTQNTKVKKKIKTSEHAAQILYYLGETRSNPIVFNLCNYFENLLNDLSIWPDNFEKNDTYKFGVPLFIASHLAFFESNNQTYLNIVNTWVQILNNTFINGYYDALSLSTISKQLIGLDIVGTYINLNSKYVLYLLIRNYKLIDKVIFTSYLTWLKTIKIKYIDLTLDEIINQTTNPNLNCKLLIKILDEVDYLS